MNIKFDFVDSKTVGRVSFVSIKLNNEYLFDGKAYCNPDDFFSDYSGCKIAEIRAERKAYKFLLKQERKELHKLENFVKAIECYKDFDKTSKSAKCVYRQLNRHRVNVKSLTNAIRHSIEYENKYIKTLDELNKKQKAKED